MSLDHEQEIIRLRDRQHEVSSELRGLELRMREVEATVAEHEKVREKYVPLVDSMAKADEIAAAVLDAQRKRGYALPLGPVSKVVGIVLVLVTIAGAIKGLLG